MPVFSPKVFFYSLFLLFSQSSLCQTLIKGRVLDYENKEALTSASVYLNNTTIGVFTDEEGRFELPYHPNYTEVAVSYVGYEALTYRLDSTSLNRPIVFQLSEVTELIAQVTISADRSTAWWNYYNIFKLGFLGDAGFARDSEILNSNDIYFNTDSETGVLNAYSAKPIIIRNDAIGYKIEYALQEFVYDHRRKELRYSGSPKFTPLEGSKAMQKKWSNRRIKAYKGSFQHFANALRYGNHREEGFEIKRMQRILNPKRPPQALIDSALHVLQTESKKRKVIVINGNSRLSRVDRIVSKRHLPKFIYTEFPKAVDATSITTITPEDMTLKFDNYLKVIYNKEGVDYKYKAPSYLRGKNRKMQVSMINLLEEKAVLNKIGILYSPLAIRFEGYWAHEKIPYLLPLDYEFE